MASVYSVSQVNSYIKNMFAQDFALSRISVRGEISNCKYHTSGHIYFTLKDKYGTLSAVMFASQRKGLAFKLQEGQQVVVRGSIEVYERDGKYQLYAAAVELAGLGDLYEKFIKLKTELEEMGMFSPEYKQPIPKFAQTVGVVTASTGAAIRDIINISSRRNPYTKIILYPALVQGQGAAESIAKGIKALDAIKPDIIIVGRGGGSIEDLWAFNEEIVARAIFECSTPVISAVGHETDTTIADYVADMRAPTPSAAAELAVFDYALFESRIDGYMSELKKAVLRRTNLLRSRSQQYTLQLKLHHPTRMMNEKRKRIADAEESLNALISKNLLNKRHRLALIISSLKGLSPLDKMSRGYGFITDKSGEKVISVSDRTLGETIQIQLKDGKLKTKITDIDNNSEI